jgi:hypothetical protein
MLISCSNCSARVNGEVQTHLPVYEGEQKPESGYRITLLRCPSCQKPVVAWQNLLNYYEGSFGEGDTATWSEAKRVWPSPESVFDASIPTIVEVSLSEARGCLLSGHYTASVVMSGRALEAVAKHFHLSGKADRLMLAKGLEELRTSGKIDDRLYQWGKELQLHRNLAAHASDKVFGLEDAEDLFEFVNAICEYLFVLQDRYDRFIKRKAAHNSDEVPK